MECIGWDASKLIPQKPNEKCNVKFLILAGNGDNSNELVSLTFFNCLFSDIDNQWDIITSNKTSLFLSQYKDFKSHNGIILSSKLSLIDKKSVINRMAQEFGTIEFILINCLGTQLEEMVNYIQYYPHWVFYISECISKLDILEYVDKILEKLDEEPQGNYQFWYPIYAHHSHTYDETKHRLLINTVNRENFPYIRKRKEED